MLKISVKPQLRLIQLQTPPESLKSLFTSSIMLYSELRDNAIDAGMTPVQFVDMMVNAKRQGCLKEYVTLEGNSYELLKTPRGNN